MCSAAVILNGNYIIFTVKGEVGFGKKEMFMLMKESFITHSYHWLMIHSVLSDALLLLFYLPILQISLKLHPFAGFCTMTLDQHESKPPLKPGLLLSFKNTVFCNRHQYGIRLVQT